MLRLLLAAILCAPLSAPAEVLSLRSGAEVQAPLVSMDGRSVRLGGGRVLRREDVRAIRFAQSQGEAAAFKADPAAAARGRELFALADGYAKKYPGAEGLQLLDEGEAVVRPDGTWFQRDRFAGLVLKEGLKQSWGRIARSFEEGRERVRILKATVHHRDGGVFPFDPAKVQVSAPQAETLFFQDVRVLSYPLPEVEVGSIIEWEAETETYNPFRKDFFFPRWGFQVGTPSLVSRFSITVPKGRRLYTAARNFAGPWKGKGEPKKTAAPDGATTYAWRLDDVPPIVGEPSMVPYFDYAPSVKAALFDGWGPIYDWLAPMYAERAQAGPELARFARELTAGAAGDDEKAAAIYHYIQREIRYVSVKMGVASGWGGYDADLTWKRRYGCCIDKALLFTAMLRAVGIASAPVLLDPNDEARHDFRLPDIWFGHAITHLVVGGRGFFLDSTGYDTRYPGLAAFDHGATSLDVLARRTRDIPVPKPEDNLSRYVYAMTLDAGGGAAVHFDATYAGVREAELRGVYKSLKESEQRKYFQGWINEISPSAELTSFQLANLEDLSRPFAFSLDYRLKDYLIRAGDLIILKLPDFEQAFGEVALDQRRYALQYPTSSQLSYRYEIALPPGFAAASLPAPVELQGPRESFALRCASPAGRVVCDAVLSRAERTYAPAEYPAHKAFLEKVSRLSQDRLFLRAGGAR